PGNVIDSGYVNMPPDKVLAYHETPDGQWAVTVQPVDENGDAIYGERPRMHRTDPTYPPGRAPKIRPAYVDVRNPLYVDTPEGAAASTEAPRARDGAKAQRRGQRGGEAGMEGARVRRDRVHRRAADARRTETSRRRRLPPRSGEGRPDAGSGRTGPAADPGTVASRGTATAPAPATRGTAR